MRSKELASAILAAPSPNHEIEIKDECPVKEYWMSVKTDPTPRDTRLQKMSSLKRFKNGHKR